VDDVTLTKSLCEWLGGIEGWAWRETGEPYSDDAVAPDVDLSPEDELAPDVSEVGVFYGRLKPSPDRAVGVRIYGTTDVAHEFVGWRRAQLRFRGDPDRPDGADELAVAAFARLQGLSRLGGISGVHRESMAPLGADQNGREERSDNYIIILDNQEAST
jgi:hypothetical protein